MDLHLIKTNEDIQLFLKKTNSLHDGYVIGVQYVNDAVAHMDDGGYFIDPDNTKLVIRVVVTSIDDTIVEIEFEALKDWQIKDNPWGMQDTSVFFDECDNAVWSDDVYINADELKKGTYVIAGSMSWRIVK